MIFIISAHLNQRRKGEIFINICVVVFFIFPHSPNVNQNWQNKFGVKDIKLFSLKFLSHVSFEEKMISKMENMI